MSIASRFVDLKIRTKIMGGFGMTIFLAGGLAAFGVYQMSVVNQDVMATRRLADNMLRVLTVNEAAETMRRVSLRFYFDNDKSQLVQFNAARDMAVDLLGSVAGTSISQERIRAYNASRASIHEYDLDMQKLIAVADAASIQRAKLFRNGDLLSAAVARAVETAKIAQNPAVILAAEAMERDVLLVRVANWRFLATKDPSGIGVFKTNQDKALKSISVIEAFGDSSVNAILPNVRAVLQDYASDFAAIAGSIAAGDDLLDHAMRPRIEEVQQTLGAATKAQLSVYEATGKSLDDTIANLTLVQQIIAVIGLVGGILLAVLIGRAISGPVGRMTGAMRQLADGDTTVEVPDIIRKDEIGQLATALQVFKDNMIEANRLGAEQEASRAARSQRQDAMDRHTKAFGSSVTGVMAALGNASGNMRGAADTMTQAAAAVHSEASETAEGAGRSSADLIAVAAAVEQFSASVSEISRQVTVSSDVAKQAVQRAEASQATIRELSESTVRIGDVVRLIEGIASQTNLLALNATIEAARAGDAGKGFAVVAGEVKTLAAQTARATAEIATQIGTVRAATDETVAAMNDIGAIIGRMGEVSTAISAAVEEQSATTREIAASVQGVASSTAQAAQAMEHVVQVAVQAGDASRNILSEASEIGTESEKLRHEVEAFLNAVKADSGETLKAA